jgi:hypothetical protein
MSDILRENNVIEFRPRIVEKKKCSKEPYAGKYWASIHNIKAGDHVTELLWTDRQCYTVISINKRFVVVQEDTATKDPSFKPNFIPGGFSVHCTNNGEQQWVVESNPNGATQKFGVKRDGRLQARGSRKANVVLGSHYFYDFNF